MWPLPNVWLGVSVETQHTAKERVPLLLKTPAAKRVISAEPLLGYVDLTHWLFKCEACGAAPGWSLWEEPGFYYGIPYLRHEHDGRLYDCSVPTRMIDWVIVGCESGPGSRMVTEMNIEALRRQCELARIPFFLKQMRQGNRMVKMPVYLGKVWDQVPA